ncbi:MAG: YafY family transcriptional regulator [Lachnospiraceae bacterium]|nr:YafY family transcriptional regulator [Lachnospiraceae bacterium]MDE7202309.1 YafY family transcriptional regulator [Lachnospiraceae bacterium]
MKIDRQIGILSILLQKDTVTAPCLAEQFEVSRRTINRDIEDLCKAGIPIMTRQGVNGGISIMDHYKMDRTLLTSAEMQDIIAGIRSLDSVNETNRYGKLMEKLSVDSSDFMVGNQSVLIDLSSWYKDSLASKIELIRTSIDKESELEFLYYSPKGESERCVEPYYLIFRWSSWYLWGWCKKREDFRLFKLNRMDQVKRSENTFSKRQAPMPDLGKEQIFPGGIVVKALFERECKWRLVEEFGPYCFTVQEDGSLLFQADYTDKDKLITWLLSFRDKVKLLEPKEIRAEMRENIERMRRNYMEEEKFE